MPKIGTSAIEPFAVRSFAENYFIMSNRFSDTLFQLIHSLEKSEKRHFKLYIKRSSAKEDLKIVQLFDALDKMHEYDEKILLKKLPGTEKPSFPILKHIYTDRFWPACGC